ncbi:MAG: hypothetical protein ACE5OZ_24995 [Candidatus Heimdallarchaeota archaeon]
MAAKNDQIIQLCQELLMRRSLSGVRLRKLFGEGKSFDGLIDAAQKRLSTVGLELVRVEDRDGEHYSVVVRSVDPFMSEEMIGVFCIAAALIKMKGGSLPKYEAREIFRLVLSTLNSLVDRGYLRLSGEDYQVAPVGAAILIPIYDQLEEILTSLLNKLAEDKK